LVPGASRIARIAIALASLCCGWSLAQSHAPRTVRDIYMDESADREASLAAGAKKEGSVVLYSTLTVSDAQALGAAFERKYGVKVMAWRGGGEKIVQRAMTEARAGRYDADVFEMNGPQMEILYREKLLEEFRSPAFRDIPPAAFPPHRHYVADRFAFYVMAFNTRLIKPDEAPRSYEDVLDPKWRGKIGLEATDAVWFAAVVKAMGEERGLAYFHKLAAMKPDMRTGHILLAELVAAGEVPLTLTAYNNNVETLKKKGAPIEWRALQPAFGRPSSIGPARHPAHPHAAALFVDFVLSREGQEILEKANRVPASRAVPSPLNRFDYRLIDPAIVLDEWDKWSRLWSRLFLGGRDLAPEK
jgi:iron(III) transport system substrate-binding protein